ncbi:MAG: TetR/AcrR family transcriptional regulator [Bacteroidia bacterium]
MPRQKNYDESQVALKAMDLFWSQGYTSTSTRMLEQSMGINLFSIYASFNNKEGVLLASIKHYQDLVRKMLLKDLVHGPQDLTSIKQFFYAFLDFTQKGQHYRGCLMINTANELGQNMAEPIAQEIMAFSKEIMTAFTKALSKQNDPEVTQQKVSYLFVALQGMVLGAKMIDTPQIKNYIEMSFQKL